MWILLMHRLRRTTTVKIMLPELLSVRMAGKSLGQRESGNSERERFSKLYQHLPQHLTQARGYLSVLEDPVLGIRVWQASSTLLDRGWAWHCHTCLHKPTSGKTIVWKPNNVLSHASWWLRTTRIASPVWMCCWSSGNGGKHRQFPNLKKSPRLLLRGFAFGKFCQVTQADAILGIFLRRFSKPSFSNILVVSNIA